MISSGIISPRSRGKDCWGASLKRWWFSTSQEIVLFATDDCWRSSRTLPNHCDHPHGVVEDSAAGCREGGRSGKAGWENTKKNNNVYNRKTKLKTMVRLFDVHSRRGGAASVGNSNSATIDTNTWYIWALQGYWSNYGSWCRVFYDILSTFCDNKRSWS